MFHEMNYFNDQVFLNFFYQINIENNDEDL